MKSKTKRLVIAFTILLGVIGETAGPLASTASAATPVVEVQTFGAAYGEWSARWWQWALSIPAAVNPILDKTGANCAQGQEDDVWFLAGAFGGTVPTTRTCTIPAAKPIFFPLINNVAFKPAGSETLLDLRHLAAMFINTVSELRCTIDGAPCDQNLFGFRVRSPSFSVIAPTQGLVPPGRLSGPGNTDSIVSDGYWLLIKPLPAGQHTIAFHAKTVTGVEVQNVTYHLTITP